jgi:CNT family concentrative nucleoside transporter
MLQMQCAVGLGVMLLLAWCLGGCRRVAWRPVVAGTLLQFAIAWLVLRTPVGGGAIAAVSDVSTAAINSVEEGCRFVFGENFRDHFFAFKVVPAIIFVGSLMSLLYHFGILQRVVAAMGWVMRRTMGTTGAESLCAAANIFLGQTEAPLVVRPYLAKMSDSELMAVMVTGYATIAGGVMAAFISMGIDAGHLLTASVISAPAALAVSKLLEPQVDLARGAAAGTAYEPSDTVNALDALARGAADGLKLGLNVAAMIIAFLGLVTLVDLSLQWCTGQVGAVWTLSDVFGWLNAPFAWLMGVTPGEERAVGELLGLKLATNEFLAYQKLTTLESLSDRSRTIAIYALCGFANLSSIGIQIGGLGQLAPERRADIARMGLRAMLGGTLACYMTACVAGIVV